MLKTKYQQPTNLLQPGAEPEDLGLINTIQSLEKKDLSGYGVESPFAPRTYAGVDFDSYDEYIQRPFSIENEDIDDLRAYNQSVGEKSWYGVQKLVGKTGTAVVGGIGMLVHGLPNMLVNIAGESLDREGHEGGYKDAFRSIFENDFQRSLDGVNEWMDEKLPSYYTKEEQNMGVWEQMLGGSANFWTNDFVNGLSFVAGAVLTEFATAGLATAVMPIRATQFLRSISRANEISRATTAVGTVSKFNQAARWGQVADVGLLGRRLITGAGYESGVEARHHYDQTMHRLDEMWRIDNPTGEPTIEDKKLMHDLAVETTNAVFVGNLTLVGAGNMIAFPRIFGSGFNASKRSIGKITKDMTKDITSRYAAAYTALGAGKITSGAYTALKVPLYEGYVEEGGQALLDLGGQEAALSFYADKKHPGTMDAIGGMIEHMYDNFAKSYGDKHVQKEIALGFILGAIGLPTFVKTDAKTGKAKFSIGHTGGIAGQFKLRNAKREGADKLAKWMNENPSAVAAMKNNFDALTQSARASEKQDYALMTNNIHSWQNARHDHFFSYVYSRAKAGFYEDVVQDINDIKEMPLAEFSKMFGYDNQNLTEQELESRRDKVVEKALDRSEEIRKATEVVGNNFSNFSDEVQEMLIHSASTAKDVDARTESIRKSLQEKGANLTALEDDETSEMQTVNAFKAIAKEKGVLSKVETLVRSYIQQGADITKAYTKAFQELQLLAPEESANGQAVEEAEFSEASLRYQLYTSTLEADELQTKIKALQEKIAKEYTQDDQNLLDKLTEQLNVVSRKKGKARKALEDGMEAELTTQDMQVLSELELNDPTSYAEHNATITQDLIDLRKLRARRHSVIGLYNSLKTPEGQKEALQQIEDIINSQKQRAVEAGIEDEFIRNLYSQYGNGQIFEFDYKNAEGKTTNYRAIFINPKQIMILPSSVAANFLSRFKYEARLKELEGQTDKKSLEEVSKIKKIIAKYFPVGQTENSIWDLSPSTKDKMSNIKAVSMEEYRLELLKRAVRNLKEKQLYDVSLITQDIAQKELEINNFFENLIAIEDLSEVPGVSVYELNEQRVKVEGLITAHEGAINTLKEHKLNIEREARHLDTILEYYKDTTLTDKEKFEKILGISTVSSIQNEAKTIFTEFGLESDPVYNTLLAEVDMDTLASAIEASEFLATPTQDYLAGVDNAIQQYERALIDLKRTRDFIEATIRSHAAKMNIAGATEFPIEWLVELINKDASDFFKEELALNEQERAQITKLLDDKRAETGARERASALLQTLSKALEIQEALVQEFATVMNFMNRFFTPPASTVENEDPKNPHSQGSLFGSKEEHDNFFRYAPSLLNDIGFFKTAGAHQQAMDEYARIMAMPLEERELEENQKALAFSLSQQAFFKFVGNMTSMGDYLLQAVSPATPIEGIPHFNENDIKLVIVDATTGVPIKDTDNNLLFTSMMEANAFTPSGEYRFAKSDFVDPANPTSEELLEVDNRVKVYADFRQSILASEVPVYLQLTDKNNAIRIFEDNNYNAENSVVGRVVKDTTDLKNLSVIVAVALEGETHATINFMKRSLIGKNGMVYTVKNGQLVHLRPSKLATLSDVKDTVYNLLVQYARNEEKYRTTNDLELKDVNKIEGSEKNIDLLLKEYIYWGAKARERKLTEYSIYWEKGILKFGGTQSITHSQLLDPINNEALHDELKSFLSTLTIQVNRPQVNSDISARETAKKASKGKKTAAKPGYTAYIQTIVDENGTITTKKWANYTEFLLSERNGIQPALTTNLIEDIEYVDSKKLVPNQRITNPQFLNPYLKFSGQLVGLKPKKSKTITKNQLPEQATLGGLEVVAIENGKTYRIYGTITGDTARTYIDAPVRLVAVNGVEMLQFDLNGAIPQPGIEDVAKLTGRLNALNINISNVQGVIHPQLLARLNTDFAGMNQNVQMTLVEVGEADPLAAKKWTGMDTLGFEDVSDPEAKTTSTEEGSSSVLDSLTPEDDDAPFLSTEYAGVPSNNYTTWDPIAENAWYNSVMPTDAKGNLLIPMEVMKNLIDGHAFGKLSRDGRVLIFKDALEGIIYHEAFHGVTRLLMPLNDRLALYDEVRSMRGKVTTYRGAFKEMSQLTDKEADEWLAEEFRHYKLANGNYKIGKGRKLSLLDTFMQWLDAVLNFLTGTSSQVQDLFDRIDSGGFKNATIINELRADNVYFSPGDASFTRAVYEGMTPAFTDVAINNRDLSFYDFYDLELNGKDAHRLAGIYGTVADITANIKTAPMSVLKKLAIRSGNLKKLAQSPKEKAKIETNFKHILDNWQKYVEGHLKYIKYFNVAVTNNSVVEEDVKNDLLSLIIEKDQTDPTQSMGAPLKLLLGSAPMIDKNGNAMLNELGFYKPVDFYDVVGYLYRTLANSSTEEQLIEKFTESILYKPELKSIGKRLKLATPLNELKDGTSSLSWGDIRMRLAFINQFNQANDDYLIYMMDEDGTDTYFINANVNKLESVLKNQWKSNLEGKLNMEDSPFSIADNGAIILDKSIPLSYRKSQIIGDKVQQNKAKTVEKWLTSPRDFTDNLGILKTFGIEFSNIKNVNEDTINDATYWMLLQLNANESPVSDLFNSDLDIGGRMNALLKEEARTSSLGLDLSFQNQDGQTVFGVSQKTYLNVIVDKLNNMTSEELELLQNTKANLRGSYWIDQLKGGMKLKVSNLQGSRIDTIGQKGTHISKGTKGDIGAIHLTAILDGITPFVRSADIKSEYAIGFGVKNKIYSYTEAVQILSEQLLDEVRTAALLNSANVGGNVIGYKDNAIDLRYFKDIVTIPAHLLDVNLSVEDLHDFIFNENIAIQLKTYLEAQSANIQNFLKYYEFIKPGKSTFVNIGISSTQLEQIADAQKLSFDGTYVSQALLDEYTKQVAIRQVINVIEMSKIVLGDLALFTPNNIFKRTKLAAGAKTYPHTGVEINEWLNENTPRLYGTHKDELVSIIREDIKIDAEFIEEYVQVVQQKYGEQAAENVRTAMSNMDEFDGGGFIHLDAYRSVNLKLNEWGNKQEIAFNIIESGEKLTNKTIAYFPDMKPQYFGDFNVGQISLKTGYKFALFPIHENMVDKNSTLFALASNMREQQVDIQVFGSVTKFGAVTQPDGNLLSMYRTENVKAVNNNLEIQAFQGQVYNPIIEGHTRHILQTGLMGMQVKQDAKLKYSTTVGTQERTLIKANLFENGILTEEFSDLAEVITAMDDAYEAITEKGIDELVYKTGLVLKDGQYTFNNNDASALESFVIGEMESRDMSRHLTDSVTNLLRKDSRFVDLLMSKPKIENLLISLGVSSTIKQKTNGSMMVQRANSGMEIGAKAIKQKDFELNNSLPGVSMKPLKFYRKGENGNINAMQILLPHHFKELIGMNPNITDGIFDKNLFNLIGFRIPTETLASIEFIEVVGFLPEGYTSIVVPSEIVGKSGSDYDIDKLTLYFPNYEISKGKFQKVLFLSGRSTTDTLERLLKIRNTEPGVYMSLVSKFLSEDTKNNLEELLTNKGIIGTVIQLLSSNPLTLEIVKDIKNTSFMLETAKSASTKKLYRNRLSELNLDLMAILENSMGSTELFVNLSEFADLTQFLKEINSRLNIIDQQLLPEFSQLPLVQQNTKKALQNVVLDSHYMILSHPENYANLLTPIGAPTFKTLRDVIVTLKTNQYNTILADSKISLEERLYVEEKLAELTPKNWSQTLSFTNIITKSSNMWSGLGGVGVSAVAAVDHIRSQQIGQKVNPEYLRENFNVKQWFEGFDLTSFNLSGRTNSSGTLNISTGLSELSNGYVDVTADDWVFVVNAGLDFAPTWTTALRSGLDIMTFGLFMNQPIIDEFIRQKEIKQSAFRLTTDIKSVNYESDSYIISNIQKKFKNVPKIPFQALNNNTLARMVGASLKTMNNNDIAIQLQVLSMLQARMELGSQLSNVHKVISYDTNPPKDRATIIYQDVFTKIMQEKNIFLDVNNEEGIKSILDLPVLKGFKDATELFPQLYKSLFVTESLERYKIVIENFIRNGIEEGATKDDIIYRINRFENYLITHTLQASTLGDRAGVLLKSRAKNLMQGVSSLPRRVATYKRSISNLLLEELHPILQKHTNPKHPDYSVDNLNLRRKKLSARDLELLGDAYLELYDNPRTKELAEEILYFSLLQSGTNFSSMSIFHAIPDYVLTDMALPAIETFSNSIVNWPEMVRGFYSNSWKDGRISTYIGRAKLRQFIGFKTNQAGAIESVPSSLKGFQEGLIGVAALSRDSKRQSMTVSVPLVNNTQLALYKKAGKTAPKATKLFINSGQTITVNNQDVVLFTELNKKGNGNRHIETGVTSIHMSNNAVDAQLIPNTTQPFGLKSVRGHIASGNISKLVLPFDLKTEAGGDGIIKTADNAILKIRKLGAYNRQELSKQKVKTALGITNLDDLMAQAGLNNYPFYATVFKNSTFVTTQTKGNVHIYEVEILNSGYYTADTTIEVKQDNTESMVTKINKDNAKTTAAKLAETDAIIKQFEEDSKDC